MLATGPDPVHLRSRNGGWPKVRGASGWCVAKSPWRRPGAALAYVLMPSSLGVTAVISAGTSRPGATFS